MDIDKSLFGTAKTGKPVFCFTLTNKNGMKAQVLTYGGILRSLWVPAAEGLRDVVLGFDCLSAYEQQEKYIGALIGRYANRIGGGRLTVEDSEYFLGKNDGKNCLHGGFHGFHEKIWEAWEGDGSLLLSCFSPDGEEGFPGNLKAEARYILADDNTLAIELSAECDAATAVNLTNHSYFNLTGRPEGGIASHRLHVFADRITEIDETGAATGRLLSVAGTPFDFQRGKTLGEALAADHPQLALGNGLDHSYVLKNDWSQELRLAAVAETKGLRMECLTTQPGLQLYTANYLAGEDGKAGASYQPRCAFCLETQNWPDATSHSGFPDGILPAKGVYHQTTLYRFSNT